MPNIVFDGPELTKDKKKKLVEKITTNAAEITGIPERAFVVIIKENKLENIGVGGQLLADKEK